MPSNKKPNMSQFTAFTPKLGYSPEKLSDNVSGYDRPADAALFGLLEKPARKMVELTERATTPGMVEVGNIDLLTRPVVKNADGSVSTVRIIGVEYDGLEYLIPTVSDDGKVLSDEDARKVFESTGRHLGIFTSRDAAKAYADGLHKQQEKAYIDGVLSREQNKNTPKPQQFGI
jgi:hypothetical protein